jgi:hypothetical protein
MKMKLSDWFVTAWVFILLALFYFIYNPINCGARWSDSGMKSKWSPISGCKISEDGERWIPEDKYREFLND